MKSEIKIILDNNSSNKAQGNCFEELIRNVIETQRFEVLNNVRFTGMEIDLLAKHKDRSETAYIECKAKEKVSSVEIRTFCFNTNHRKAKIGYFISTQEYQADAAGLIEEISDDTENRYGNLTFFGPAKIIEILVDASYIKSLKDIRLSGVLTKRILAVTYFGNYYVYIIKENNALPTHYYIFKADTGEPVSDKQIISKLEQEFIEIKTLDLKILNQANWHHTTRVVTEDVIAEVQESEYWHDYRPASIDHFVGRSELLNNVFNFFDEVLLNKTQRRVFYLKGKSGWGKSSIIATIRGKARNIQQKNKYFVVAIDCRSATSDNYNFVALCFKKAIDDAIKSDFIKSTVIETPLFNNETSIYFTSNQDLLDSDSIKRMMKYLHTNNKTLVLIFDQFEDVFRKIELFKSFYKFLTDVNNSKSNIIVGFSWKTEIIISAENPSYRLFQLVQEFTKVYEISAFGKHETNSVIKQLEDSIEESLEIDLKNYLRESSQGFPWLIKKLSIHIYDQVRAGKNVSSLIDENLNVELLFKRDKEELGSKELDALRYIAKRAYDGNFFEETEINDKIAENVISFLRDKRLIIKSGANYNIYWDIFRDYLVTDEVPQIGESYILTKTPLRCLKIFLLFKDSNKLNIDQIQGALENKLKRNTLDGILYTLRSLGLIKKISATDTYILNSDIEISEKGFRDYVARKFNIYTPYINLIKSKSHKIDINEIELIIKNIFKNTYNRNDITWNVYARTLIEWIYFSQLPLKNRIVKPVEGYELLTSKSKENFFVRVTASTLINAFIENNDSTLNELSQGIKRDLKLFGLLQGDNKNFKLNLLAHEIKELDKSDIRKRFSEISLTIPKIKYVTDIYLKDNEITSKGLLLKFPEIFRDGLQATSKNSYAQILLSWAKLNKEFLA